MNFKTNFPQQTKNTLREPNAFLDLKAFTYTPGLPFLSTSLPPSRLPVCRASYLSFVPSLPPNSSCVRVRACVEERKKCMMIDLPHTCTSHQGPGTRHAEGPNGMASAKESERILIKNNLQLRVAVQGTRPQTGLWCAPGPCSL